MPSQLHEALVEMLRAHPELVLRLVAGASDLPIPKYDTVTSSSADLGAPRSPELAADCLVRAEHNGRAVLAIVVEVQLAVDLNKKFTWPSYRVAARSRHRCDAILVVVTPSHAVAVWAQRPILLGPKAGYIQPMTLGPRQMPTVVNLEQAMQTPELAVLSAITHGHDHDVALSATIANAAIAAAFSLTDHRAQVYYDLIQAALSEAAREALKMIPQNYEYQDEGLRRAKTEGKAEGKAEAMADALIGVLNARGFGVSEEIRRRITTCSDVGTLSRWHLAAVSAPSIEAALSA